MRIVAALMAIGLAGAAVGGSTPQGKIAVTCDTLDPHAHQICTVNPDGSGWKLITHGAEKIDSTYPEFSPDGKQIVFVRGPHQGHTDTYVMNADGSGIRQLTHCAVCYGEDSPTYSPDGRSIAFHRDSPRSRGGIFLMDARGGHVRQLTRETCDCYDGEPSFSPDGRRLVFTRFKNSVRNPNGTHQAALFTVSIAGGQPARITAWALGGSAPDWSPDGRLIVFGSYSNEGLQPGLSRNLYLVHPDGTSLVALTHAKGGTEQNYQPSWSPDGKWIAFTREPNSQRTPRIHGDNDVYIMRANGTDLRRIAAPPKSGGFDVDWGR
jgi:Tol biopolymer transport system component